MLIIISTWNIILKIAASETKTDIIGMINPSNAKAKEQGQTFFKAS